MYWYTKSQMNEKVLGYFQNIINEKRDLSSIEMGCGEVQLFCTTGKIKTWIGRQASNDMVIKVLRTFSRVDSSFTHEKEIICDFDQIPVYENYDYTLVSYGKIQGDYRVLFNIRLSKQNALDHLIESIIKELEEGDINKTFHWKGTTPKLELIYNELNSSGEWNITKMEYRDDK